MSHELRTPLNAILGFNQLLDAEGAELSDKQRRYLHHVDVSGRNLLSLVNEVLDLSRVVAGDLEIDLEEIELAAAAAAIADAVRPLAELRGQLLEVEVRAGCLVKADRRRLGQSLTNLIANAIKFTPDGGRITVRGRHLGESSRWRSPTTGSGSRRRTRPGSSMSSPSWRRAAGPAAPASGWRSPSAWSRPWAAAWA